MEKRNFAVWLNSFKSSIATYTYYVNFPKVYSNVNSIKIELNILNSLIGSNAIWEDFERLLSKYPEVLKCIPILLATRLQEIYAVDCEGAYLYNFTKKNYTSEQYAVFMQKTGLFDLLEHRIVNNLLDYVTGVETGLDSNGRKNRGGHLMEDIVEDFLAKSGVRYYKEMKLSEIEKKWNIRLSAISNDGKTEKRFDFVVKTPTMIYGIEANFYNSGGSKLNETARSYKTLAEESKSINGFTFVWFTDGEGWFSARHNLEETFDILEHVYSINDMENGIMDVLFV
ncbi:type II restriction endonuclease MboI [Spirochaetia bacterium]|nr:type II restriction endonuclease MboI [Spirochaetia bacterium]